MNCEVKNFTIISGPAESTNVIFQKLKYNPISGETVPLSNVIFSNSFLRLPCLKIEVFN
jgi:hypothetical protein